MTTTADLTVSDIEFLPIITAMALEIRDCSLALITVDGGITPTHEFRVSAAREFERRGGEGPTQFGAVAYAVLSARLALP